MFLGLSTSTAPRLPLKILSYLAINPDPCVDGLSWFAFALITCSTWKSLVLLCSLVLRQQLLLPAPLTVYELQLVPCSCKRKKLAIRILYDLCYSAERSPNLGSPARFFTPERQHITPLWTPTSSLPPNWHPRVLPTLRQQEMCRRPCLL